MSAITALTAQNTTGIFSIMQVTPQFLQEQLKAILTDITPDAVKIGMTYTSDLIKIIYENILSFNLKNIILDPVMISTSGTYLLTQQSISNLCTYLLPKAKLITPNTKEAEVLTGHKIKNSTDMEKAAVILSQEYGCSVLIKGGHCHDQLSVNQSNDYLYSNNKGVWFYGQRISNPNNHGTGCTLSSAIASNIAKGYEIKEAVQIAKDYTTNCLNAMLNLGKGNGPMSHNWKINY